MPRSGKGGKVAATPGASYTNRTDLQAQPVRAATGQAYGAAGAQMSSQQAVPLPDNAAATASIVQQAAQGQSPGPVTGSPMPEQVSGPMAGSRGGLTRPTDQPGIPVTNGAPSGAGAGPEALGIIERPRISNTLAQIARASGNPDLMRLAQNALSEGN